MTVSKSLSLSIFIASTLFLIITSELSLYLKSPKVFHLFAFCCCCFLFGKILQHGGWGETTGCPCTGMSFSSKLCSLLCLQVLGLLHYPPCIYIPYVSEVSTPRMRAGNAEWMAHFILCSTTARQPALSAEPPGTYTNSPFNHLPGLMTLSNSTLAGCHSRHQPGMPNRSSDNRFRFIFQEQKHCSGLLTVKSA